MSLRPTTSTPARARRTAAAVAAVLAISTALAGCAATSSSDRAGDGSGGTDGSTGSNGSGEPAANSVPRVQVRANATKASPVAVDKVIKVTATNGTFQKVSVAAGRTGLAGRLSPDKSTWTSTGRLEPGLRYRVHTLAVNQDGKSVTRVRAFRTEALPLAQQTYPSIAPLQGETVGVGMPVIVSFDVAVTDKKAIEEHLSVVSKPAQKGSWYWISDHEAHWRPKSYWKPGTDVTVHADIDSIPAGNGVYGQLSRTTSFHIGDAVLMNIDVAHHVMRVHDNGKLLRTIPVTAGMAGFTTRSGIKVIIEKDLHKRMDAATIGIAPGQPNYYNISDVQYAQRVTYSGEFIHAAPWSEGSQGFANVSHGCVGMSTTNAAWLYGLTKRGDVVDVTGTDRYMTLTNGYGDWNLSWKDYKKGSVLS
jgi:lipoprotein-anchoring transpeptidase ErfK/SrfK